MERGKGLTCVSDETIKYIADMGILALLILAALAGFMFYTWVNRD